jgi:hypothetical protein
VPEHIEELTLGSLLPALSEKDASLKPPDRDHSTRVPLKDYLNNHHSDALDALVCLDLTVYEHGLESIPRFLLVAPDSTFEPYVSVVKALAHPTNDAERNVSVTYSVAVHKEFLDSDRMVILHLPARDEQSRHGPPETLVEIKYALRHFTAGTHECPPLSESFHKFRTLLEGQQDKLITRTGAPIGAMVCCNFRVADPIDPSGFRTLGQIFLGLSRQGLDIGNKPPLNRHVRFLLRDLACLLYRTNSAELLAERGLDEGRATFAHEAIRMVRLVKRWPSAVDDWFETGYAADGGVTLRPKVSLSKQWSALDLKMIPLASDFDAAVNQMLLWAMADSAVDLPFCRFTGDAKATPILPDSLEELAKRCFEVARGSVEVAFIVESYAIPLQPLAVPPLTDYVSSHFPELEVRAEEWAGRLIWADRPLPFLVDLSRLLIVAFREAVEHGAWTQRPGLAIEHQRSGVRAKIACSLTRRRRENGPDELLLEIINPLRKHEGDEMFSDRPDDLVLSRDELQAVRDSLHLKSAAYSPVGAQGRRQAYFFVKRMSGEVVMNEADEDEGVWRLKCRFSVPEAMLA